MIGLTLFLIFPFLVFQGSIYLQIFLCFIGMVLDVLCLLGSWVWSCICIYIYLFYIKADVVWFLFSTINFISWTPRVPQPSGTASREVKVISSNLPFILPWGQLIIRKKKLSIYFLIEEITYQCSCVFVIIKGLIGPGHLEYAYS